MIDRLRERGWDEDELEHFQRVFSPRKEGRFLLVIFFLLLAFATMGVPYAYAVIGHLLSDDLFYLLLILIGAPLGAVFGVLLVDMYRLSHQHHVALLVSIPLACGVFTYWAISFVTSVAPVGAVSHNALIGALIYAVSFSAPYAFLVIQEWNSRIAFGSS